VSQHWSEPMALLTLFRPLLSRLYSTWTASLIIENNYDKVIVGGLFEYSNICTGFLNWEI